MLTGMTHTHLSLAILYVLMFSVKCILFLLNSSSFEKYRKATMIPEMIIATVLVLAGLMLFMMQGAFAREDWWWFAFKLFAVVVSIPLGIRAFRENSKPKVIFLLVLFIYILVKSYLSYH